MLLGDGTRQMLSAHHILDAQVFDRVAVRPFHQVRRQLLQRGPFPLSDALPLLRQPPLALLSVLGAFLGAGKTLLEDCEALAVDLMPNMALPSRARSAGRHTDVDAEGRARNRSGVWECDDELDNNTDGRPDNPGLDYLPLDLPFESHASDAFERETVPSPAPGFWYVPTLTDQDAAWHISHLFPNV